ncbi:MAG: DUF2333 family protein [Pseudomonadota bacterium]
MSKQPGKIAQWLARIMDAFATSPADSGFVRWSKRGMLLLIPLFLFGCVLSWYWSREPDVFWVNQGPPGQEAISGYATTDTLIRAVETLLDKPGGYLLNDIGPPGVVLDNMPNWEYGVLVQVRDLSRVLRNDYSRSQSQSTEDPDLAEAEPAFNFPSDSWILPPTEREYRKGVGYVRAYRDRLVDPVDESTQFFSRADNLREWLAVVEKRLGSLSQRLSASVGQDRVNTDLAGEAAASSATAQSTDVFVKTPWYEIDDVFYESRGTAWALVHFLRAAELDFREVLDKKNAAVSLRQIIRELEASLSPVRSPIILNGHGFGMFANHSLVMANYLSRANAAVIDLRDLLAQG